MYVREPTEPLSQVGGPRLLRERIHKLVGPMGDERCEILNTCNTERTVPGFSASRVFLRVFDGEPHLAVLHLGMHDMLR